MDRSRRGAVEEIEAGASAFAGLDAPGYYGDGLSATEPVMTLSGGGRVARRRSMGGQLRKEARRYARRTQLAGLGGLGASTGDPCTCPPGTPLAGRISQWWGGGGGVDAACMCNQKAWGQDAFEYVGQVAINTVNNQAGTDIDGPQDQGPDGTGTAPPPSLVQQVQAARLAQAKGYVPPRPKKSPIVPIVAGAAAIGLLIWLL